MPQTNAPPGGPLPLSEAFAVGPLLQAGWDALSRSPVPLLLGAFVFFLIRLVQILWVDLRAAITGQPAPEKL